jgi:hypothetical protein
LNTFVRQPHRAAFQQNFVPSIRRLLDIPRSEFRTPNSFWSAGQLVATLTGVDASNTGQSPATIRRRIP